MANNRSQPPYTPEQARARAKAAPKPGPGTHKAGTSSNPWGKGGAAKIVKKGNAFKPGLRAGARGRN